MGAETGRAGHRLDGGLDRHRARRLGGDARAQRNLPAASAQAVGQLKTFRSYGSSPTASPGAAATTAPCSASTAAAAEEGGRGVDRVFDDWLSVVFMRIVQNCHTDVFYLVKLVDRSDVGCRASEKKDFFLSAYRWDYIAFDTREER